MDGPKILLLDIETQPDLIWAWGVYEENAIEVKEHWQLLSFSAKWLNGEHITKCLCDYKGYRAGGDDKKLAGELWHLLDRADFVVAHNGKQFDIKKINARFIVHGLQPPSPYQVIDTKTETKKVAGFSSNKLDWLCSQLHLGRKVEHEGFPLWKGCMFGDRKAWKRMKAYNRHDVILLEKLYLLLRPWIKPANHGMFKDKTTCPRCGSGDLQSSGYYRNKTTKYRRIKCNSCGAWSRATLNEQETKPIVAL